MTTNFEGLSQVGYQTLAKLLQQNGYPGAFSLTPLNGGTNNKVYRVTVNNGFLLLKKYFHHRGESRNRLKTEFSFCRFAWEQKIQCVPKPIAFNLNQHLGLYEFIKGRPIEKSEIKDQDIQQTLSLFHEINQYRKEYISKGLSDSLEPSYTLLKNLRGVENRIQAFKKMNCTSSIDREAYGFIQKQLIPLWERISEKIIKTSSALRLSLKKAILKRDRCLSHSDIGFHNAIRTSNGELRFIDFEYAGWDDPAKMVCVFFSCPKIPVPIRYLKPFEESVASILYDKDSFFKRVRLLLPLHRIRWFCILLNVFSQEGSRRRRFAFENRDLEYLKFKQLEEVRRLSDFILEP